MNISLAICPAFSSPSAGAGKLPDVFDAAIADHNRSVLARGDRALF
ncbi:MULTISPECIES: hypothetical protein [Pseudomonas]|nr:MULTISPECIES: hypothetical protein [Pseudomonas]